MASLRNRNLADISKPDPADGKGPGRRLHAHFAVLGGVELDLPARTSMAQAEEFSEEQLSP